MFLSAPQEPTKDISPEEGTNDIGRKEKQMSNRYQKIIDFNNLRNSVKMNLACKECHGNCEVTESTCGLATEVQITCENGHYFTIDAPKKKDFKMENCKTNLAQFTINYLAVLLSFYLGVGLSGCCG
mmetsp:Transcript_24580/g.37376  ORF Transcript_24580/g.37376 Transcript_24580/m.37376 type:complete len:127 (-) Transcript_24580:14-394(-)